MGRILLVGVALVALSATTVWASRCGGYAETSIVFCDDFDQYCTANNPANPWPGYPPAVDTKCATNATPDSSFFQQSFHWPSLCGTDSTKMGIATDSWGIEPAGTPNAGADNGPFYARLYGGLGVTAQYQRWDLTPTIAAKHPGKNAINGTDANPLYLRFYIANNGSPTANNVGYPPNAPMYVELALDEERAPTDYVVKDCAVDTAWQGVHDCNCVTSNPDATCNKGTCGGAPECSGVCAFMECDGVTHTCPTTCGSPHPGQACTQDSDCSVCVGGFHNGLACSSDTDCKVCSSGSKQGQACTNQDSCPGNGTCSSGPHTGNNCRSDSDCGACVGGSAPGTTCSSDVGCQIHCGSGQSTTCQNGPHQGVACVHDSPDCDGGAYYPIVVQQRLNTLTTPDPVKVPHPPADVNLLRKSLAYGLLAQLDLDPCNLENGRRPTNYHSNVFDGNIWTDLRANVFPGNGEKFNSDGLSAVYQMWVKTDTFVVWLDSTVGGIAVNGANCLLPQHSEATVPRKYKGPFNRIAVGVGPACRVDTVTGACITGYSCWDYPKSYGIDPADWHEYSIDNLVMTNGVPVSTDGACCKHDTSCTVVPDEATCLAQGGTFQGQNTTCATTVCCPYPFADADKDGDVDQDDFGAFQICYTGPAGGVPTGCSCYDRTKDNDVDVDDFTAFSNCWTGPNVPWSAVLTPLCTP